MAQIITTSLNLSRFNEEKYVKGQKENVFYNITIKVHDKTDPYGNGTNVTIEEAQTQEERQAGKKPHKISSSNSGKVVWTNGISLTADECPQLELKSETKTKTVNIETKTEAPADDLPF